MRRFIRSEWLMLLILLSALVAAVLIYPYMPERIPIHWNIRGEVDNYGSREFGTFFIPLLNIAMYLLFLAIPKLDPKRSNYERFSGSYRLIRYAMHIFMTGIFAVTALVSLGYDIDISLCISVGVALLFIIMGNIMGKVKHNYFVGFKYPWTLANEEVWKKTHRFGSKAMVIGGIAALAGVLLTENGVRFIVLMAGIFIPTILTTIYSYLVFRRISS